MLLKFHKLISRVFVSVLIVVSVLALGGSRAHAYQSPGNPTGYVNDFAHVLPLATVQSLGAQLQAFEASTTNQIVVVTVPSLNGEYIEQYAAELFKEWGIGQKGTDNGVLIVVAVEDRETRIEVGYGLEGALPDSVANRIIQDGMIPYFRTGDYVTGITNAVNGVIAATQGEYQASPSRPNFAGFFEQNPFLFGLVGLFLLRSIVALGRTKSWWLGGVLGGIIGASISFFVTFLYTGLILTIVLIVFGLVLDFLLSRFLPSRGIHPHIWFNGPHGPGRGGGFGGFGGGMSGGGGASGRW